MIKSIEEGRKEDGNRSIADKIIKRLHDLEKTVKSNHGRWAWELLQNAKDSVSASKRTVEVKVILTEDSIDFQHTGDSFTEKDIRGLINQISSKEVAEGEETKQVGRFGTGFLTTHLLSKIVIIRGIVRTENSQLFQFEFPLNREGKTTAVLIPRIEEAWRGFHASTEDNEIDLYDDDAFNTSFKYMLVTPEQQAIARTGVNELSNLAPYVLSFVQEIGSIEIIDEVEGSTIKFENKDESDGIQKFVTKYVDGKPTRIRLLFATDGVVSVAARVTKGSDRFEVNSLSKIPKLFCSFPLIGTESFHFPFVVNSFYFNPQTERDGIWLEGDDDSEVQENRKLLLQALELYKTLIANLPHEEYRRLYNISQSRIPAADERYFDAKWYRENVQKALRTFLLKVPLVEREDGTMQTINEIWFPLKSYDNKIREAIWQYTYDLNPQALCRKEDLHHWLDVVWEDVNKQTYEELVKDIAGSKTIKQLKEQLDKSTSDTFEWYNEVGAFLVADEINLPLFEKHAFIPNQQGTFCIKSVLYIDKINDPELVKVLQLLKDDWNRLLKDKRVYFDRYPVKEKKDIANAISDALKKATKDQDFINAVTILSEWFDNNPEEGKELFGDTYRRRAELFMNTIADKDSLYKVMRSKTDLAQLSQVAQAIEENPRLFENIEQAKDIYSLLKKYGVQDLDQLREILDGQGVTVAPRPSLLPITQEILANMGISSPEEWEEAIADKDLAALFSHKSTPTTDMFVYVQGLIREAKASIIAHLQTLENYNLENLDDTTAPTILAGILKDGREISVVARPAYNGEVIIYYGSERDILDYEPSELWVDDGIMPRQITLGHILKTAQIIKFPV